ncbi:MAG: hypothetical protein ACP5T5_06180 [Thermoprotei archaeon]
MAVVLPDCLGPMIKELDSGKRGMIVGFDDVAMATFSSFSMALGSAYHGF